MGPIRISAFLLAGVLAVGAGAQTINAGSGTFIDISTTGGTAITGVGDDTNHLINTTVGNSMFPAGPVWVCNNGHADAGTGTTVYFEYDILPTGVPAGLSTTSTGIVLPWWDDLYPFPCCANAQTLWWQQDTVNGVLAIMWKDVNHYSEGTGAFGISFEVLVFANPGAGPWIQYIYNDVTFGGTYSIYDAGSSAAVGYVGAANPAGNQNVKWSFDQPVLTAGLVLNIYPKFSATASSPLGLGSLQIDFVAGPSFGLYFLGVTFNPGGFPNGWFYGIDIPFVDLAAQINAGYPFLGGLDFSGNYTIGPVNGLPSGLQFYAVALGVPSGSQIPTVRSTPFTYAIP